MDLNDSSNETTRSNRPSKKSVFEMTIEEKMKSINSVFQKAQRAVGVRFGQDPLAIMKR